MPAWTRALGIAVWSVALVSVLAALWLTVWVDSTGGVTLLLLRRTPAWGPVVSAEVPWQAVGWKLLPGNENGVWGEALVDFNAHTGVFFAVSMALVYSALARLRRRSRRDSGP